MRIDFIKLPGNRHAIEVRDRKGPDLRRPPRETGPTLPHDLAHAAVEQALGLTDGFWAAIERGAMFEDFELLEPARHRRAGIKQYQRLAESVFPAELAVSWAHRVWSGQRTEGRGLGSSPLSAQELRIAIAALDAANRRWAAVPDHQALRWDASFTR